MNIAVLGTGIVGRTIGTALVRAGHVVRMGSRTTQNAHATAWSQALGEGSSAGTFAEAAFSGELIFNCTSGAGTLNALALAGEPNLDGKILIDVANPLDFSHGFPPVLSTLNTDSLGEQIQRTLPGARVVKTLNTMNCNVMVNPARVPGRHHVFLSGNDASAKTTVADLLHGAFGWEPDTILDLGDITTARGVEMILPLWVRLYSALGTPDFNFHIAGAARQERKIASGDAVEDS